SSIESLDDGCVFIEGVMLESASPPGCWIAFDCEQIFGAPGNSMERTAKFACRHFGVGLFGLGEGALFSDCDDEMQFRVVALEAREIHLGERERSDLARVQQAGEVADRCE